MFKKFIKYIAIALSIPAIILSIIAICVSCSRENQINFDYMGVIVGVLSLLITVLVGWNIFTLIDIRRIQEDIKKRKKEVDFESRRNMCVSSMALSDLYYEITTKQPIKDVKYKYLLYRISAMFNASIIKDIDTCNSITKALLEQIKPKHLQLNIQQKESLLSLLVATHNKESIQQFSALLQVLLNA